MSKDAEVVELSGEVIWICYRDVGVQSNLCRDKNVTCSFL